MPSPRINPKATKATSSSTKSNNKSDTPGRRKRKEFDNQGLFDILRSGKSALRAVVDDWIESYNKDRENAMVDLIQLIVQCCGCKGTVSGNMLQDEQTINAVKQLTEQFEEESHEYPLITTGPLYKKFKENFCAFFESLVSQCQHEIVYDEYMMDILLSWLIRLSDSDVRAFRHTSTLAGMKLVTALIHVANSGKSEVDYTERQLESESHKVLSKKAHEKLELLKSKSQELKQNISDLEEMMNFIFQGMFVHRYRDSRPEIRALCIQEIGLWMLLYSSFFLTDRYLKYLVWTLHDKVGDVRLRAVLVLQKLYEKKEFTGQLEALTERFKDRFVAMTLDKDSDVAVEALKLVTTLQSLGKLEEEDCQQVELLVFCSHRMVAHAAGIFLAHRLTVAAEQEMRKLSPSKRKGSPTKGTKKYEQDFKIIQAKKLIEFLVHSEIHSHGAYLVDSVWGKLDILKDWKLMTDMLRNERKSGLNDTEETALVDVMVCACKQATQGQGPPGRIHKKVLSSKEKNEIVSDTKDISAHFMNTLPDLLNKFSTEIDSATNLVQIPQLFDLDEYGQRRLDKRLEELLDQLCDIVEKHTDKRLLEECAKTFETLTNSDYPLSNTAKVSLQKLIDTVVEHLKKDLKKNATTDDNSEEESFSLLANLQRVAAFNRYHNLEKWNIYDNLNPIIVRGCKEKTVEKVRMTLAIISVQMVLLWNLKELDEQSNPSKAKVLKLKKRVSEFVQHCHELLLISDDVQVQRESFLCAADILVFFAKQLTQSAPHLQSLVYEADETFQCASRDFVLEYVFSNVEEEEADDEDEDENDVKAEELANKRLVLAAFCKLISFGMFEMRFAARIFAYYNKGFGNYGDLIKVTMAKCREANRNKYTKTLLLALQLEFEKLKVESKGRNINKLEEFKLIKELAHRFSLTFGVDTNKTQARESLIMLHREAILYSFSGSSSEVEPPPNLEFLEILNEFSARLIPQDKSGKNGVLKYLEEHAGQVRFTKKGGQWSPLTTYKTGLAGQDVSKDGAASHKGSRVKRKLEIVTVKKGDSEQKMKQRNMTKRKRSESPEQHKDEESLREEVSSGEEDESLVVSSQVSWLASQPDKAYKRPRVSYSKRDSSRHSGKVLEVEHSGSEDDV